MITISCANWTLFNIKSYCLLKKAHSNRLAQSVFNKDLKKKKIKKQQICQVFANGLARVEFSCN
jgi:hypothetical protein